MAADYRLHYLRLSWTKSRRWPVDWHMENLPKALWALEVSFPRANVLCTCLRSCSILVLGVVRFSRPESVSTPVRIHPPDTAGAIEKVSSTQPFGQPAILSAATHPMNTGSGIITCYSPEPAGKKTTSKNILDCTVIRIASLLRKLQTHLPLTSSDPSDCNAVFQHQT